MMPERATIRPLHQSDEAEWLRLRLALWPEIELEEQQREMAAIRADLDRQAVFVAECGAGRLCGLVEVSIRRMAPGCRSGRIGYLEARYVDPEWRKQGVGRRLVEAAEASARTVGCREMASDTTPDYPASPQAHASLGYQEVELYFRKDLD
jgi:aminoglycoside 6'-N-acetyltransferase I